MVVCGNQYRFLWCGDLLPLPNPEPRLLSPRSLRGDCNRHISNRSYTDDSVRDYLRLDEVDAMVQAAHQSGRHRVRDAAIILMMFRHGLRTAELVALRWQQVDLKAGYLDVHRVKRGHNAKHPLRGPQLRLLRELQHLYLDSPYVFVSERKAPLSPRSIREIVARTGKLAGLLFVPHPHQLRHACGYYLASHGHDTRAIQDYLGHKNIQHTVRYTAMAPQRFENFWND
jgi:type 1 fimbriae regulatory protein FimE